MTELAFYVANAEEINRKYRGKHIAIVEDKVVASGDDDHGALRLGHGLGALAHDNVPVARRRAGRCARLHAAESPGSARPVRAGARRYARAQAD